jgi:hypothetical protein
MLHGVATLAEGLDEKIDVYHGESLQQAVGLKKDAAAMYEDFNAGKPPLDEWTERGGGVLRHNCLCMGVSGGIPQGVFTCQRRSGFPKLKWSVG